MALLAGRDYPNSYAELRAWFNEDWKCLNYLDWLRWPDGECASLKWPHLRGVVLA